MAHVKRAMLDYFGRILGLDGAQGISYVPRVCSPQATGGRVYPGFHVISGSYVLMFGLSYGVSGRASYGASTCSFVADFSTPHTLHRRSQRCLCMGVSTISGPYRPLIIG